MSAGEEDPEEVAARSLGVLESAMTGIAAIMRPTMEAKLRVVLERNATLVDQRDEALAHLTRELMDALLPPELVGRSDE